MEHGKAEVWTDRVHMTTALLTGPNRNQGWVGLELLILHAVATMAPAASVLNSHLQAILKLQDSNSLNYRVPCGAQSLKKTL